MTTNARHLFAFANVALPAGTRPTGCADDACSPDALCRGCVAEAWADGADLVTRTWCIEAGQDYSRVAYRKSGLRKSNFSCEWRGNYRHDAVLGHNAGPVGVL